jgi:hypothetical protein
MTLSAMSIWLGAALALVHGVALLNPSLARRWIRSFPRSRIAAWILTAVDVAWVAFLLYDANIELIHRVRWIIPYLAPVAYVMIIFCMNELLAPRAFGGLLLLLPAPMLDAARWHASPWRLVIILLAYLWVVEGGILVLSPYRFRRWLAGWVANDGRCRLGGALGLGFGVVLVLLGFTMY